MGKLAGKLTFSAQKMTEKRTELRMAIRRFSTMRRRVTKISQISSIQRKAIFRN